MPEGTLKAFADHGELGGSLPVDRSDAEAVLSQFVDSGINIDTLAARLQEEGVRSFVKSWNGLMDVIALKCIEIEKAS
jgi:transaldolase